VSPVKHKTTGDIRYFRHNDLNGSSGVTEVNGSSRLSLPITSLLMGFRPHPAYQPKLKGIKALERNPAVLGQLLMWAEILRTRNDELFPKPVSRHLGFGEFVTVNCPAGVLDADWLRRRTPKGPNSGWGVGSF